MIYKPTERQIQHDLAVAFLNHRRSAKTLRAARAVVAPELNRPIIEVVEDRILEELENDQTGIS
jgi:hypothetical protein